MNRQLALACKALGLEGVSWHTLRHSNAMLLDALRTARSRAGTSRALLFGDHPRGLSALAASRSEGAVEKMEALLKDPNCANPENGKPVNTMKRLGFIGRP
jgi:hypothetical protein